MGRAPPEHAPAIVVGLVDFGEADRVVRLLSPDHGLVAALARRARSSRRRFGGALDLGNKVEAALRPGRGELWHLDAARLLDGRLHAHGDVERLGLLAYTAEVAGALARPHHPEPRLFGLLDVAGVLLDSVTAPPSPLFRMAFEAKALTFAGLRPALDRCAGCGRPFDAGEERAFAPWAGGAVHPACQAGATPVPPGWTEAVEAARRTPLRELVDAAPPPGPRWLLADAIEAHLGRALRSRRVLAAIAGPPAGG